MHDFTFKREERLKSYKVIGQLFKVGQSFGAYPLRLVWNKVEKEEIEGDSPVKFGLSVPKRNFKSAVARNRIRRKVREAWRLNKHMLYKVMAERHGQLAFMVLYTAKEDFSFSQIEAAMIKMIKTFIKKNSPT